MDDLGDAQSDRRSRPARSHLAVDPGESLAACVLVKPEQGMTWLPLAAGLALVRALRPLVAHPVGVKWPNDVQIEIDGEARKVAGILCEMRDGAVVVGFGVNLVQQADALLPTAVSLRQAGAEGEATALAERVLDDMRAHLRELAGQLGTPALREQIEAECLTLGLDVRAELPGDRMIRGRAVRLDDDGGLVIDTDAGETAVVAGDVVHLRARGVAKRANRRRTGRLDACPIRRMSE